MRAFTNHSRRRNVDPSWAEQVQAEAHAKDPKHIAAMKRRKKRKRGGPK